MAEETTNQENETKSEGPVTFISRYRKLRIVVHPGYSKEVDGRRVSTPGESIRFEDGQYTTEDEKEIEFLRNRPEFGKHIQEVPENVEDLASAQEERFQNLEDREAAAAAKEADLAAREAALTDAEAGRTEGDEGEGGDEDEGEDDGLEDMDRPALVEKLKAMKDENPEGLEDVNGNSKSEDIIAAIRKVTADRPAFEE